MISAHPLLRFKDLRARKICNSWPQLKEWGEKFGFPLGRLMGPNMRVWTEEEIAEYFNSRPAALPKPEKLASTGSTKGAPPPVAAKKNKAARAAESHTNE